MKQDPSQPISLLCTQWKNKLARGHISDLSIDEKKKLNEHLANCLNCTRLQFEYRAMNDAITRLPPVQPLAGLPDELVALMKKQRREDSMYNHETSNVTDLATETESIHKRKTQRGKIDVRFDGGSNSRWVQTISSLAAVLVVGLLIGAAFVLFSHRPGSGHTAVGSGPKTASSTPILTTASTVLYTNLETKQANIYAIDTHNGSVFWKVSLPTKLTTSNLTSYQGLLFAPGYDGNLYALNTTNGAVVWKYLVKNDPTLKVPDGTNVPSSPSVNGNVVYFGAGSGFYAINIHTGELLWHIKESCKITQPIQQGTTTVVSNLGCNLVLGAVANGRVYTYFNGLSVLDAQTGKELWHDKRFQFTGPEGMAVVDDNVYVYSSDQNSLFILNASNGREKTKVVGVSNSGFGGSVLAADGVAYYNNGQALLALDGTQILWTEKYQLMDLFAASNGTLFVSSIQPLQGSSQVMREQGTYFYALNTKTGAIKWHWGEKGDSWGPGYPLSFEGKLYFFSAVQQGNKWTNTQALWVLHDGQRDMFPV